MTDQLRDTREPGFFIIENEIIDIYGDAIGVYGISVYNLLARYANSHGDNAFPSYETIASKLAMSRRKAIEVVDTLVYYGLITKTARKDKHGDATSNLYSLVSLKKGKVGGSAGHAPQVVQDMHHGSAGHAPDQDIIIKTPNKKAVAASQASAIASPSGGKKEKKEDPTTKAILDAYVEARGKNGINYGKEGKYAKLLAKEGRTPTQVKGCYLWLDSDPWWTDKVISLLHIYERMDKYLLWADKQGLTTSSSELSVIDVDWNTL